MRCFLPSQPSSSTAHRLAAATIDARLCATPGERVPAAARLPARGHLGLSARAKVQRPACGAALCHRKSTLAPPHLPHHHQARAIETPILGQQLPREQSVVRRRREGARGGLGAEVARLALATPDGGPSRPRGIAITPHGRYAATTGAPRSQPSSGVMWVVDIAERKVVGRVAGMDNETYLLVLLP